MLTFLQYVTEQLILEGGGLGIFHPQQGPIIAHAIPKKDQREGNLASEPLPLEHKEDIHHALIDVGKIFHKHTGEHLFGHGDQSLHNHQSYAGSTRHVMKAPAETVRHWFGLQGKKGQSAESIGDFDVHGDSSAIDKHGLDNMFNSEQKLGKGNVRLVGMIKAGSGHHLLFHHTDDKGQIRHVQVDLLHTKYDGNAPNKDRAIGTGSEIEDLKQGIKGVSRQELASAMVKVVGGKAQGKNFVSEKTGKAVKLPERDQYQYRMGSESNKVRPGILPHPGGQPHDVHVTTYDHVKSGRVKEEALHDFINRHFGTKYTHTDVSSFTSLANIARKHMEPKAHKQLIKMWYDKIVQQHPGEQGEGAPHVLNAKKVLEEAPR